MSAPDVVPLLELAEFDIPQPEEADGPVARWEANDGIELVGYRANGTRWIAIRGLAAFRFDRTGDVAAAAIGGSEQAIRDAWVRSVLPLVMQARGTQVLHASAVAGPSGVVALCGTSTAGKSTMAAALQGQGHRVVADDALAFVVTGSAAHALTLPFRLRLRPASAAHLELPPIAEQGDGGERLPLAAIVLLEPGAADGDQPRSVLVAPTEAVGALMPHAYCFSLEEAKEALVRAYAALTGSVLVQRLSFPRELEHLAGTVEHVEALLSA
ncbi:hypothetical protein BH18ACT13_BH18ACT13_01590 [soil metagenome]